MTIIQPYDEKHYVIPSETLYKTGEGLGSLIASGVKFINDNKDAISAIGQVGNIAKAASEVTKAVKAAQELKDLNRVRELRKKAEKKGEGVSNKKLIREVLEKTFGGKGFYKI